MSTPPNPFPHLAQWADVSQRQALWSKISECIATAAKKYPMRGQLTQAEIKRRVDFCVNMANVMIRERGWTVSRTIDHIWPTLDGKLSSKLVVLNDRAFYPVAAVE